MGYTHYFSVNKTIDPKTWIKICQNVSKVLEHENCPKIQFESDSTKLPLVDKNTIRFNGVLELGHETFYLEREGCSEFCKTAQKPYDMAVVAVLCIIGHFASAKVDIASDGDRNDWEQGLKLAIDSTSLDLSIPDTIDE